MKKATSYLIVTLLSLLVILPNIAPVFAQPSIYVEVGDVDSDEYPDIKFTATNAL